MERLILVLCAWLLPLCAIAGQAPEVSLRLVDGTYRPGDMLELQAEMRGSDYAEFELHVPANAQLHFVANTREPVHYVEGEYVQRVLLLLQPMNTGTFELTGITATIDQDGVSTDVALPSVPFTVASYVAEDTSEVAAELGASALLPVEKSVTMRVVIWVLFVALMAVWLRLKVVNSKPVKAVEVAAGLNDLILALEGNAPSLPPCEVDVWKRRSVALHGGSELASMMIAEQLLERSDLSLSPKLREHLETAVYANRMDAEALLELLRQEVGG